MKPHHTLLITIALIYAQQVSKGASLQADSLPSLPLSLAQVWERATIHSRVAQIKELQLEGSAERVKDAKADRLPEINLDGEYARITNMPVYDNGIFHSPSQFEVLHSTYTLGADAYFNLYNGNKSNIAIAARKTENKIAAEQRNLSLSEIKLRAAAYYLDMQRSIIFRDLVLKDIAAQEKQLMQIKALKTNGVVLKSDVLRAELKLSRQQLSLVQLDNDLAIANEKLNILIGLPKEQRLLPARSSVLDSLSLKSNQDYLSEAGSHAYPLRISEQETELKKLELKNIRANVSPKIGLFAMYKYSYPQIFLYPYSPYLYGIGMGGIKASFSISSIYHNNHKAKVARLELESQEMEHEDTRDHINQQVDEAYRRFNEALNRIAVSKTNIGHATENRRIVSNTYFNQTSLITDLLDADTQLLQTRFDLAAAEIAAQLQYFQLQNITGNL
jgi:outer membrane protein TolC